MTRRLLQALPNALSLGRLALGLGFPWVPPPWRAGAVVLAALSDVADGALSRRLAAGSLTGRILDPIADKVFVLSVLVTVVLEGELAPWAVVLLALRDLGGLVRGSWGLARGGWPAVRLLAPTLLGKATTVMQFVFLLALLGFGRPVPALFVATVLVSGLAAADYVRRVPMVGNETGGVRSPHTVRRGGPLDLPADGDWAGVAAPGMPVARSRTVP
jgi:phosphatidylglycerophosphate synthase